MFVANNLMIGSENQKGVYELYSSRRTNTEQPGYQENDHYGAQPDATVVEWHYTWGSPEIAIAESVFVDLGEERVGVLDFRNHQYNWSSDRINSKVRFYDENHVLLGSMNHTKYISTWSRTDDTAMDTKFYDASGSLLYTIGGSIWSGTSYGMGQTSGIMYLREPGTLYINPEGQNSTAHQNNNDQVHSFNHGLQDTRFVTLEMYAQSSTYTGAGGAGNTYAQIGAQGSLYRPASKTITTPGSQTLIAGRDFPIGVPITVEVIGSGGNGGYSGDNDQGLDSGGGVGGTKSLLATTKTIKSETNWKIDVFVGESDLGFPPPPGSGCSDGPDGRNGQDSNVRVYEGSIEYNVDSTGGLGGAGGECVSDYIIYYVKGPSGIEDPTSRLVLWSGGSFVKSTSFVWDGSYIATFQEDPIDTSREFDDSNGSVFGIGSLQESGTSPTFKDLYEIKRKASPIGLPGEPGTIIDLVEYGRGGNGADGTLHDVSGDLGGNGVVKLTFHWDEA